MNINNFSTCRGASMARDTADCCRNRFSAKWSARRECELLRTLAHEGTEQMRMLWLRSRQYHTSHLQQAGGQPCQGRAAADPQAQQHAGRQPRDGQPSQRRAAAHPQAQQKASRQPKPAAARAQDVPKPATEAQAKRRERSWEQLKQKHLARALARARTAPGLHVWCARARVALEGHPVFYHASTGLWHSDAAARDARQRALRHSVLDGAQVDALFRPATPRSQDSARCAASAADIGGGRSPAAASPSAGGTRCGVWG